MRWWLRPECSSSSASVAKRNSRSGAPSNLEPTSSRSALRFLSVNGTVASVRLVAGAPIALEDHARAERPGLDQVQGDVFGDRRQERRAATDGDWIAEHAQLVDEAELDRRGGQAGAADPDVIVGR